MANFDNIKEFLRLRRRSDEANKKIRDSNEVLLTYLEDSLEFYSVSRNVFENDNKYKRLVGILELYSVRVIYIWDSNLERKYLIKNNSSEYINLLNENIENPYAGQLTSYDISEDSPSSYFYDVEKNRVVTDSKNIPEIALYPDHLFYDPNSELLKDIANMDYTYSFSNPNTIFGEILSTILKFKTQGFLSNREKQVTVTKSQKIEQMKLFPFMQFNKGLKTFNLKYAYYKKDDPESIFAPNDEDCALILNFHSVGGFLSFLNETIFTQGVDLSLSGSPMKKNFQKSFKETIIYPLEMNLKSNVELYYRDALEILYYLPGSISIELSSEILWLLLEEGIRRNGLNNDMELAEEDIYIKILENLLRRENEENNFIERLSKPIDKNGTLILEYLYDRIHGGNGVRFASLVNKAWRKTRFVNPDAEKNPEFKSTDGPLMLPYESKKWLGLYFSNAKVDFESNKEKQRIIHVECKTKRDEYKASSDETENTHDSTPIEIIDYFWYHPFYPIYLKNIENQETEMKLDSIVPAFMLKANRDKQFWSNVITTAEYAADILTTLSGVGNIAKFRYLTKVAQLAEVVESASAVTKVARAANILRYVKGAAGVVELTSGSVNLMLKITGARDTELGESLSKVLFYLELITLAGELTASMKLGLKKSAKESVEASDGALRVKHPELFSELYKIAGLKKVYQHIDDFMKTRSKFHDLKLVNQLWKEKIINKMLFPTNLRKLYFKYLEEFPGLKKGFNQAEFKTTILNKGQKVEEVVEFSLSGDKGKLTKYFGNPPDLPENTIDILSDYDNFEAFVKGAKDFGEIPKSFDSEIKYIFNFLKNHIDKGDEFIIETQNIFKTCGSCQREFVMLEDYLKLQGKKVKIVVMSDETIKGTARLKEKLKIKKL